MTSKPLLAIAALLSATGLSGCSGSEPDAAPIENRDEAASLPAAPVPDVAPPATSTPTPDAAPTAAANAAEPVPPETAAAPDEQMMDDATATGMTARAARDQPPADDTTPVEQVEKK